jgi:IMP dehydrogenase
MLKQGFTILANATIRDAVRLLDENDCGVLVVVDNKKIVGIISEKDVVKKVILCDCDPEKTKVVQVMSDCAFLGNPEMDLSEAARIIFFKKVDFLPIVCREKLVGIIYLSDVIRGRDSIEQFKGFAESATSNEMKQAMDIYFTLDDLGKKCPLMVEQGYPKKCRKSECMWWIGEDCAIALLSRTINNKREEKIINNF